MGIFGAALAAAGGGASESGDIARRKQVEEAEAARRAMDMQQLQASMAGQGIQYDPVVRTPGQMPGVGYGAALAGGMGERPGPEGSMGRLGMAAGTTGPMSADTIMPPPPDFQAMAPQVEFRDSPWVYDQGSDPRLARAEVENDMALDRFGAQEGMRAETQQGIEEFRSGLREQEAASDYERQQERDRTLHQQTMAEIRARSNNPGDSGPRGDAVWQRQRLGEAIDAINAATVEPLPGEPQEQFQLRQEQAQRRLMTTLNSMGFSGPDEVRMQSMEQANPGSTMPPPGAAAFQGALGAGSAMLNQGMGAPPADESPADMWERLVQSGMEKEEATRTVQARFPNAGG